MRSIAQAKSELKADKLSALERRQKNERGVVRPQGTTIEKDRKLRKIATSGGSWNMGDNRLCISGVRHGRSHAYIYIYI